MKKEEGLKAEILAIIEDHKGAITENALIHHILLSHDLDEVTSKTFAEFVVDVKSSITELVEAFQINCVQYRFHGRRRNIYTTRE